MSQTLLQIQEQIARLRRDEQRLKVEAAEVISKIRVAIEAYGFTPDDLFGATSGRAAVPRARSSRAAPGEAGLPGAGVKFADGQGNVWGGRGPRPIWLRTALAQGHSLADFAVDPRTNAGADRGAAHRTSSASPFQGDVKRRVVAIKYRDGDNVWSGRGSHPRWLREAIESGCDLEQFRV